VGFAAIGMDWRWVLSAVRGPQRSGFGSSACSCRVLSRVVAVPCCDGVAVAAYNRQLLTGQGGSEAPLLRSRIQAELCVEQKGIWS
jgi:hypothetical protein